MLSGTKLLQLIIGFLGAFFSIAAFWIGNYLSWSTGMDIMAAISVAIITVLFELIASFNSLKTSIQKLYPSLAFSVQEQKRATFDNKQYSFIEKKRYST